MSITAWVKRNSFPLWAFIIWLILCVPQNVVTLVMYYYPESPDTRNRTLIDSVHGFEFMKIEFSNFRWFLLLRSFESRLSHSEIWKFKNSNLCDEQIKCYDFQLFTDWGMMDMLWLRGIIIIIIASCGIIGNLFSILVLQRLASRSGFNKLLLALGI